MFQVICSFSVATMSLIEQEKIPLRDVESISQCLPSESKSSINKPKCQTITNRVKGILLAIVSGGFFTTCTVLVKLLRPLHPHFILAVRGVEQTFISLILAGFLQINPAGPTEFRKLLVAQGILGGLTLTSIFFAFHRLPVGDASTIIFSAPVFVMVLGSLFLKEPFTIFRSLALLLIISGGALITRPPFLFGAQVESLSLDPWGLLAAFAGTFFYSITYIVTRKLKTVHFNIVLFYYSAFCTLVASFNMSIFGNIALPDSSMEWILLAGLGVLGSLGHSMLALALQYEGAGTISLARSLDIVLAYIFQITIFGEIPGWTSVAGALIVLAVVIGIGLEPKITTVVPRFSTVLFGFASSNEESQDLILSK